LQPALLAARAVSPGGLAAGELTLWRHAARPVRQHGLLIVGGALVVFFNLHAAFYVIARWLFLRDTGHKLTHLDGQLITPDALDHDLRGEHLTEDRSRHV
jgi:hypothetical protein